MSTNQNKTINGPDLIEWTDPGSLPDDPQFIMIDRRVTWRGGGGESRHVGRVWIHAADAVGDGVALDGAEEPDETAWAKAAKLATEKGLSRVYWRRVAAGPSRCQR